MAAPIGNKYAVGNKGGRPPLYNNAEDLASEVNKYFEWCLAENVKSTITGLALYLGFCSRSNFDDYIEKSDEFKYVIKRAKLAVENSYELSGQTIDIFALKNMGWEDRRKSELSGGIDVNKKPSWFDDGEQKTA